MNVKYGHLKTDHRIIEPCCEKQEAFMQDTPYLFLLNGGSHIIPNRIFFLQNTPRKCKCGFCGAKLEYVDKLDGE